MSSLSSTPLLTPALGGLYCEAGDFYIDPGGSVQTAVVTHAHSDHAREGHARYFASEPSIPLMRHRLTDEDGRSHRTSPPAHPHPEFIGVPWGEPLDFDGVRVSLHPAGHMLGSAQIRIEGTPEGDIDGERQVWVVTGDYKRAADPTCEPFEAVECDVLVTEATFALPIYRWQPGSEVAAEILAWWDDNRREGRPSVLFCYSAGKAQRVLAELARLDEMKDSSDRRVLVHGAMLAMIDAYREAGVAMPPTEYVTDMDEQTDFAGELILAPPSAFSSSWMDRFEGARSGFASGWMRVRGIRRRRGYDAGFVLSDHCDWEALLRTIRDTGARRVLATHGKTDALVRYLREEMDVEAWDLEDAYGEDGPYPAAELGAERREEG